MPSGSKSPQQQGSSSHRRHSRRSSSSNSSRSSHSRRSKSNHSSRDRQPRGYKPRQAEKIQPNVKLFVTNIDSKYSKEELDQQLKPMFEAHGKVKEMVVKTKGTSNNSFVFIEFENVEDATKAQEALKGKDFKGKELKVEFGRGERKNEDRRSDKCYICHKEGHFAKDCRYNRYTGNAYQDDRFRRDDRDRRDVRDRDYDRDRDYRGSDRRDRKHRRYDSYSRSNSSSKSYRHRRDDYGRRRDSRHSPDKRGSNYHSNARRY